MATIRTTIKHYEATNIARAIAKMALGQELQAAYLIRKEEGSLAEFDRYIAGDR